MILAEFFIPLGNMLFQLSLYKTTLFFFIEKMQKQAQKWSIFQNALLPCCLFFRTFGQNEIDTFFWPMLAELFDSSRKYACSNRLST
jgi:hypothetical protein